MSLVRLPADKAVRSSLVVLLAAVSSRGGSAGRCPREVEEGRAGSMRTVPGETLPGEMLCKESELPAFSGSIISSSLPLCVCMVMCGVLACEKEHRGLGGLSNQEGDKGRAQPAEM